MILNLIIIHTSEILTGNYEDDFEVEESQQYAEEDDDSGEEDEDKSESEVEESDEELQV